MYPLRRFAQLCLALLPLVGQAADDGDLNAVRHHLSFPDLSAQYVRIISRFPVMGEAVELRMASWTPGSYLIRDFAGSLDRIAAHDSGGRPLTLTKLRKNAWRVAPGTHTETVVQYDVHAGVLGTNTSWVSPDFILLNGASVFLYTDATLVLPQTVQVDVPPDLGLVQTSLARDGAPGVWRAADFDELVDNPIVLSTAMTRAFRQDGHDYRFLNVGDSSLWDIEQATSDVREIVAATNRFWDEVPLQRAYWFFNFLVEKHSGLEHDHATVMMASRWQMRDREDYLKWLSLVAHEYFHAWNVRRMRPASLADYDYDGEQYSSALWLAEGISSYYDNLLLARAKLVSPEEYFKRLAIDLHRFELTPGRDLISLEAASRDAWIRHYRPDANSINSEVSYYTKGAAVALALDTRIRAATGNRASLDDVMRRMWALWSDRAYPAGAFRDAVDAVAGPEVRDWLEPLLSAPVNPDLDAALEWYGLVLDRHPERTAAEAAGTPPSAGLGVNWDTGSAGLVAASVVRGLAASAAGVLPGDELLAIGDERITRDNLEDRLQRLRPGESLDLLVARHGRLVRLSARLGTARPAKYEIKLGERFGNRQIRRMESWLGQNLATHKD